MGNETAEVVIPVCSKLVNNRRCGQPMTSILMLRAKNKNRRTWQAHPRCVEHPAKGETALVDSVSMILDVTLELAVAEVSGVMEPA